ncbi:hypothetical protein [Pseudosulfitobacter sp. DSM 107133]|uniref:hypothetical protein n=1 Tax=Pseudosulfitobacter sp. DSM 107133 TaxID=2883100 RepID=UPI000DF14AA7|nr:hypothetical protein [Pseudosulfitobacter sp. DSM 107133]
MTALILLGLFGIGAMFLADGSADNDSADVEDISDDLPDDVPQEQLEEPDIGASFTVVDDTISIDVGDDETGSVVAVRTELDTADRIGTSDGTAVEKTTEYGVRFYLVPEGTDFPPSVDEVFASLSPEQQATATSTDSEFVGLPYDVYLDNLGAELIGSVDLGTTTFQTLPNSQPEIITDARGAGYNVQSNQQISALELDGEGITPSSASNFAYGTPFFEIPVETVADADITPADADITFEDGVIDVVLDPEVEGRVIAIEADTINGEEASRSVRFFVLPDDAPFPITVAQTNEALPERSNFHLYFPPGDTASLDGILAIAGAQEIGSVHLGGFGSYYVGPEGDLVTYDTLVPYVINNNLDYEGFIFHPVDGAYVQDAGTNTIRPATLGTDVPVGAVAA